MESNSGISYSSYSGINLSLNLDNIPSFSQVLLTSSNPPVPQIINVPAGYISIYENMKDVFLQMRQNFSITLKSSCFDYYLSNLNDYLSSLSTLCQSLIPVYNQYILVSLKAKWIDINCNSEVKFIDQAVNQLHLIIQHSWDNLSDVVSTVVEHVRNVERYLEALKSSLSLNHYYTLIIQSFGTKLCDDSQLQQHVHFYLLCLQFLTDLKRCQFMYMYPSLYLWDLTNGVAHLSKNAWSSISRITVNHSVVHFDNELKYVFNSMCMQHYFFDPSSREELTHRFIYRVCSFFDEASQWVSTADRSDIDAAKQRYINEYNRCATNQFMEQHSILQLINRINENYSIAKTAKEESRDNDVNYVIEATLEPLKKLIEYEQKYHICDDTLSSTYKRLFESLLK